MFVEGIINIGSNCTNLSNVIYSDDGGTTWHLGAETSSSEDSSGFPIHPNEVQVSSTKCVCQTCNKGSPDTCTTATRAIAVNAHTNYRKALQKSHFFAVPFSHHHFAAVPFLLKKNIYSTMSKFHIL